jgi:predicted RNase H-like HicB family nuclease
MKLYHVLVEQDEGWYIGHVMDREGVTTQGRTLDELLFMLRDAIELMWNEKGVQLELSISGKTLSTFERKSRRPARRQRPAKRPLRSARRQVA